MITQVHDSQIQSFVRSHLVRHKFDALLTKFDVKKGTVTLTGALWQVGGRPAMTDAILQLERDIRATSGVHSVSFDFANWKRSEIGVWRPVVPPTR